MKHLKYLKSVLRHKWFTFIECCKLGIPWLGITHDLSKFTRREWCPYVENFYGVKSLEGSILDTLIKSEFNTAWNHHQKNNKHHWQYWVLIEDDTLYNPDQTPKAIEMPYKYAKEMLADWRGASRAYTGGDNTKKWYLDRRDGFKRVLHSETRGWIEWVLRV